MPDFSKISSEQGDSAVCNIPTIPAYECNIPCISDECPACTACCDGDKDDTCGNCGFSLTCTPTSCSSCGCVQDSKAEACTSCGASPIPNCTACLECGNVNVNPCGTCDECGESL